MKIRLKILGVLMTAISFSACTKEEEPYQGYGVTEVPKGSYSFNGIFTLNGEEFPHYYAHISSNDSTLSCSFGVYELREDNRFYETKSFDAEMYLNDTAAFIRDTSWIPYPEPVPRMDLFRVSGDVLSCAGEHTNSGWCYAEQRDSISYFVHLEGPLTSQGCGGSGKDDTIAVELKGVFTKRL